MCAWSPHWPMSTPAMTSTRSGSSARPTAGSPAQPRTCPMLGNLYDRALDGERCWVRHDDGRVDRLPVRRWLGGRSSDERFDHTLVGLCHGPTIDLGCGPGRLVVHLTQRGIPAL